jgi:hypothetical protein
MAKAEEKQQELLKAVADVLDEAMAEYEKLCKMDMEVMPDPSKASEAPKDESEVEKADESAPEAKEDEKDKDKDKDDEESDEKLMEAYKSITAKVEARGLLKKSESQTEPAKAPEATSETPKVEEVVAKSETKVETTPAPTATETKPTEEPKAETIVAKSETAEPKKEDGKELEDFKKSIDEKLEDFGKKIAEIAETVAKIASAPVPRKGVSGLQPLRKSEEAPGLKKSEVIDKLLDLKKSRPDSVDTALITRIETNRLIPGDNERINGLLE